MSEDCPRAPGMAATAAAATAHTIQRSITIRNLTGKPDNRGVFEVASIVDAADDEVPGVHPSEAGCTHTSALDDLSPSLFVADCGGLSFRNPTHRIVADSDGVASAPEVNGWLSAFARGDFPGRAADFHRPCAAVGARAGD